MSKCQMFLFFKHYFYTKNFIMHKHTLTFHFYNMIIYKYKWLLREKHPSICFLIINLDLYESQKKLHSCFCSSKKKAILT